MPSHIRLRTECLHVIVEVLAAGELVTFSKEPAEHDARRNNVSGNAWKTRRVTGGRLIDTARDTRLTPSGSQIHPEESVKEMVCDSWILHLSGCVDFVHDPQRLPRSITVRWKRVDVAVITHTRDCVA